MDFIVYETESVETAEGKSRIIISTEQVISVSEDKLDDGLLSTQTCEEIEADFYKRLAKRIFADFAANNINKNNQNNIFYTLQWRRKEDNLMNVHFEVKQGYIIDKILRGEFDGIL